MVFLKTLKSKKNSPLLEYIVDYLNKNLDKDNVNSKRILGISNILFSSDELKTKDFERLIIELESFNSFTFSTFYKVSENEEMNFEKFIYAMTLLKKFLLRELKEDLVDYKIYVDSIEREVIPRIEAYEYVGNNFLDIKPTGREYGLLLD